MACHFHYFQRHFHLQIAMLVTLIFSGPFGNLFQVRLERRDSLLLWKGTSHVDSTCCGLRAPMKVHITVGTDSVPAGGGFPEF